MLRKSPAASCAAMSEAISRRSRSSRSRAAPDRRCARRQAVQVRVRTARAAIPNASPCHTISRVWAPFAAIVPNCGLCTPVRAISTDIPYLPARVVVTAADRLTSADGPQCPRVVERRQRTADDHPHDDHGAPSATLRPPASGSCPGHGGRDHRHGSRGPSLDGRGWLDHRTRGARASGGDCPGQADPQSPE